MAITHKLFMVEGVTGAGKSAVAEYIMDCLNRRGERAEWFEENDYEHPADYTFHAYMRGDQIKNLPQKEQIQLYAEGTETLSGLIIPLTKISVNLFEKILPYKIYDRLGWEDERPVLLNRWMTFAQKAQTLGQIFIFEGTFLQKPVSEAMLRFDLGRGVIGEYICDVYRLISELNPVIIYLSRSDMKTCVEDVGRERTDSWLDETVDYYMNQTFAKKNGLSGKEGYIACLEQQQAIELDILNSLPAVKLILPDPLNNWENAKKTIEHFIGKL